MSDGALSVITAGLWVAACAALQDSANMAIKRVLWVFILLGVCFLSGNIGKPAEAAGKTFPTLTVRGTIYTNATVTEISGGSVFLRHSRGFESFRLEDLDANTLSQLGIDPSSVRSPVKSSSKTADGGQLDRVVASGEMSGPGAFGVVAFVFAIVGLLLMLIGNILFIVAAFRTGPWWGVGVLFGGLTLGIVPLIFFFSHLQECKKAFLVGLSGVLVFLVLGIVVPNFVQAKKAAIARERAMLVSDGSWA